jgi:hypothetical protein
MVKSYLLKKAAKLVRLNENIPAMLYTRARIYRPSFRQNKPKRSFSVIENERFGLVFAKTRSIN